MEAKNTFVAGPDPQVHQLDVGIFSGAHPISIQVVRKKTSAT